MIGWQEALEYQHQLQEWGKHTPVDQMVDIFHKAAAAFWRSSVPPDEVASRSILQQLRLDSPVYWIDPHVQQALNIAAETMPTKAPSSFSLPSSRGLVVFSTDNGQCIAALSWTPMSIYRKRGDDVHEIQTWKPGLDLDMINLTGFGFAADLCDRVYNVKISPDRFWENARGLIPHFMHWIAAGEDRMNDDDVGASMREWMFAFWAFCEQRLLVPEAPMVPRQVRRRLTREGGDISKIKIVTLRRLYNPTTNKHQKMDHDHRWMVRGFWRNQWYPRQQRHRTIWIHPYIKGPEDKPIVKKQTIFKVRR